MVRRGGRVRRLTDREGQRLQQFVRRGSTSSVRFRRAMMLLASAGGNQVPVIALLVQARVDDLVGNGPAVCGGASVDLFLTRRPGILGSRGNVTERAR